MEEYGLLDDGLIGNGIYNTRWTRHVAWEGGNREQGRRWRREEFLGRGHGRGLSGKS